MSMMYSGLTLESTVRGEVRENALLSMGDMWFMNPDI